MARKITERTPVIEIAVLPKSGWLTPSRGWDEHGAEGALRDALAAIKQTLPRLLSDYEIQIDWKIETERQCEHCRAPWTEKSLTYNGGCCDEDDKANPAAQVTA